MKTCIKCFARIPDESVYCMYCGAPQSAPPRPRKTKRGNGQGSVYKMPNGKYRAVRVLGYFTDESGKKRRRTVSRIFVKKSDAIAALPALAQDVQRQRDISLNALYDRYKYSRDYDALSASQQGKMYYAWRRWRDLELRGISTLTVAEMEAQIEQNTNSYYPAHDMKVLMSHLYKIAVKLEIVPANKTVYVDLPFDAPNAKRETWTQQEVDALWTDSESHPFTAYILIMCYAGLRYGELAQIRVENIRLDESYMIGGIKTEAGIDREIPIHARIKPLIARLMREHKIKLLEMNEDNFYARYWETIRRAGLRELPPHTCRHYFFSRMTAEGVQGGIIAEVGGHANYLTTLKNYVRIPIADKIAAVNKI